MTDLSTADARDKLYDAIEEVRVGMLGLVGEPMHPQPMTLFLEREAGLIWIFTGSDHDLTRALGAGRLAQVSIHADKEGVWASLHGQLVQDNDRERIDRYWSPIVAAWYPEGKDDPNLTLLRLSLGEAAVWIEKKGPLKFLFETAKANVTKTQPDWGERADIAFR